jgi:hypothetical protein
MIWIKNAYYVKLFTILHSMFLEGWCFLCFYLCYSHIDGKNAMIWISIYLCIDRQDFHHTRKLINRKLEVVKFLTHGWNLMRGSKGSMWANLFVGLMVQVKYTWMSTSILQCCSCMGKLNIYQDGSFEYRFCFLRILLLCGSSIGGVLGRLGIFTC